MHTGCHLIPYDSHVWKLDCLRNKMTLQTKSSVNKNQTSAATLSELIVKPFVALVSPFKDHY